MIYFCYRLPVSIEQNIEVICPERTSSVTTRIVTGQLYQGMGLEVALNRLQVVNPQLPEVNSVCQLLEDVEYHAQFYELDRLMHV